MKFPHFDGLLRTDDAALEFAADDHGHVAHARPLSVLEPGSIADVVRLMHFAQRDGIPVAVRGQGHTTQSQCQVEGGIVINMASLSQVRTIDDASVVVDGGASWSRVLEQTVSRNLTPPTLTDYLDLSVGGTLSVGGVGGQTFRFGTQADNVIELEVVTGGGNLVVCSAKRHAELFNACRGGVGQFGVIVGARLRLVEAPQRVRVYKLPYADLATFLAEQSRVVDEGRFDYVVGVIVPDVGGGWHFVMQAAKYLGAGEASDDVGMLAGLSFIPGVLAAEDLGYLEFANRRVAWAAKKKAAGLWEVPHPWVDLFLPATRAAEIIESALAEFGPFSAGDHRDTHGTLGVVPLRRSRCAAPFVRLPDEECIVLFDVLRNAIPPTPSRVQTLVEQNRRLYTRSAAIGGTLYPIGSVPMGPRGWQGHFGPEWRRFVEAKRRFDPNGILRPAYRVLARPEKASATSEIAAV